MSSQLFEPTQLGQVQLKNHVVMSPMTRGRATNPDLIPTPMMAEYYAQRASAGLIIAEGTWVNREGVGYINVPGIYTKAQTEGWKPIVGSVHAKGGKIFSQLAHIGAVSHPDLLNGNLPFGPSALNPMEQTYTFEGFKDTPVPREMTIEDINRTVGDFLKAAVNAKEAGFDGVEIHAGYLYLFPEFLSSATNIRTDKYGGSPANRSRLTLEVVEALLGVWGPGRVGIKLSPGAGSGRLKPNEDTAPTYRYLAEALNDYDLAYLHAWGFPGPVQGTPSEPFEDIVRFFRPLYRGTMIAAGGYTKETAEAVLARGEVKAVAFGAPFVANPDFVERMRRNAILAVADQETFYSGGARGYIDYRSMTNADLGL